jgi:hypothetical protein
MKKAKFPTACFAAASSYDTYIEWYDTEKECKHLDEGTVVVEYAAGRVGQIINGKLDWTIAQTVAKVKTAKVAVKKITKKKVKKA